MPSTPTTTDHRRKPRRTGLVVVAIVAVGAALRLHQLGAESLWLDEAFSISLATGTFDDLIARTAADVHPPLYYVLLSGWVAILGATEWTARLLSVVFSLGIIGAAYGLAAHLFGRTTAGLAAGLLAVMRFQVEFAQEARMYTLLTLLATVSTYAFVRMLERPAEARAGTAGRAAWTWWLAYVASAALMTYTQAYGAFVIAAHGLSLGLYLWRAGGAAWSAAWRWGVAVLVVVVAYLPWLAAFATQFSHVQRAFWIPAPRWYSGLHPLLVYAGSTGLVCLMVPLAALGLAAASRGRAVGPEASGPGPLTILLPWLLCPILMPLALSYVGSPIFLPKYTIAASVPFTLLVARGLSALPRTVAVGLVAIGLWLGAGALQAYYGPIVKDDWRNLVHQVEARARPGDTVLLYPNYLTMPYEFYATRPDVAIEVVPPAAESADDDALIGYLWASIGERNRVWLVTRSFDPRQGLIVEALSRGFTTVERATALNVDAHLLAGRRPD